MWAEVVIPSLEQPNWIPIESLSSTQSMSSSHVVFCMLIVEKVETKFQHYTTDK